MASGQGCGERETETETERERERERESERERERETERQRDRERDRESPRKEKVRRGDRGMGGLQSKQLALTIEVHKAIADGEVVWQLQGSAMTPVFSHTYTAVRVIPIFFQPGPGRWRS